MTITAFLPAIGYAGTVVTITGTDFVQVAEVKFNGTAALYFTIDSDVKITSRGR